MPCAETITADVSDLVWLRVRQDAEKVVRAEPSLGGFVYAAILSQPTLEAALIQRLASRLAGAIPGEMLRQTFRETIEENGAIGRAVRFDMLALLDRDPASGSTLEPVLYFKGFHALQTHRIAHALWTGGRRDFALYLQGKASEIFQVDIHPAVPIGIGIFIDHATGISIGETARIGDNVSLLQGVVLGADGHARGDRHPKIGDGVMIGAGARILGNIRIGDCSRIGAGSIVTDAVPSRRTVARAPARVIGPAGCAEPARLMDQMFYDVGL